MSEKICIVTNGSGGCGKDEITRMIQDYGFNVYKASAICKVKDIAAMCGAEPDVNGNKSEALRKFWSDLKLMTVAYNDMPMNDLRIIYENFINNTLSPSANDKYSGLTSDYPNADILVIDVREPEEIQKAVNEFNAITVLITRPDIKQITSNVSDASVRDFTYDYEIINDGTLDELRNKVHTFIDWLKNRKGD